MGVNITYMGTKRVLAPIVCDVLRHAQAGTMLDAFSGMCSVGEAIGQSRNVWNNDIQVFASEVARALFTARESPLSPLASGDLYFGHFKSQRELLARYFTRPLALEVDCYDATTFAQLKARKGKLDRTLANEVAKCNARSPHLFATTYSGTFIGLRQAIDVDAIVFSLRSARDARIISADNCRWGTIALGRALLKISNSTGHFAQYLTPKEGNFRRFIGLRQRSVWEEWLSSLAQLAPLGPAQWRLGNRVFNKDTLALIPELARNKADISVIYADPPYTKDQYSRFYHVLETLCLYDYPPVTGKGLYRPDRFRTPFSLKSEAVMSLLRLIQSTARTGADLVLSYPSEGLAIKGGADISRMLRKYFKRVEVCRSMPHRHSTFGASKGPAHSDATEIIYLARSS